ncbi:acyl-CoA synthetase [Effusibacillus lacus]|uniref:Long-chain-fatty-acid--CoA ligase n=1 Tax=Effusibacillus lacus TaxID=1348429 RepID=A0A292YDY9_9BACL|nr:long-chain fatty acid--CoA ligase [Effusibacillus lacus]TCS71120.1 fatty-acyl-CoA synthase [Effusibacillus lacus]GAX90762.1 long-chain-fatty-acid--CoA ligase [Effusibacillus lacus]
MQQVTDWLESRSRLAPEKVALVEVSTGIRLTYQQFHKRVSRLAGYLQRSGLGKGDRIALLAPNSISYMDLLFAAGRIGAVFVPLNYRFAISELAYVLADCTPKVLVYNESYSRSVEELNEQAQIPLVISETAYRSAISESEELTAAAKVDLEDPWAIIYTGGTTGHPKGVVLSHRAIVWNAINTVVSWGITANDITPVYLPMFHTGGLNALATPVLYAGGTVVIGKDFEPSSIVEILQRENCTIALFVPTMYHMLIQTPEFAKTSFSAMHTFLSGGAPCPYTIYETMWAKGLNFKEGYGMTEAGPNNFYIHPQDARRKIGSVGVPMFHNTIRIVDDNGCDVKPGEVGEIWISGPHLFSEYWNKPEATAEAFEDGWLRTGDLGRRDEEGYHYIAGRKKDMIITGGENVYPLEVEHVLEAHPNITEVAVVGLPDPKWGEAVTAVVVPTADRNLTEEELKSFCSGKIAGYKIPKKFVFVEELPKTSVGKIDKKRISDNLVQIRKTNAGA